MPPSLHAPDTQLPPLPHGVPSIKLPLNNKHLPSGLLQSILHSSLLDLQDSVMFMTKPRDRHWASREVHWPDAQRLPSSQVLPSGMYTSSGQDAEWPVQCSEISQGVAAGRHMCVVG